MCSLMTPCTCCLKTPCTFFFTTPGVRSLGTPCMYCFRTPCKCSLRAPCTCYLKHCVRTLLEHRLLFVFWHIVLRGMVDQHHILFKSYKKKSLHVNTEHLFYQSASNFSWDIFMLCLSRFKCTSKNSTSSIFICWGVKSQRSTAGPAFNNGIEALSEFFVEKSVQNGINTTVRSSQPLSKGCHKLEDILFDAAFFDIATEFHYGENDVKRKPGYCKQHHYNDHHLNDLKIEIM